LYNKETCAQKHVRRASFFVQVELYKFREHVTRF